MGLLGFFKGPGSGNSSGTDIKQLEIQGNIRECCEKKITLSLTIDSHVIEPMSMFIMFSPNRDWILIDKLAPEVGNSYMAHASKIKVTYNLNHVTYNFSCKFMGLVKKDGKTAIKISFPEKIKTAHVRKFFRMEPSLGKPIKALIQLGDLQITREMRDISEGGFSFIFSKSDSFADDIIKGKHIELVQFNLPDQGLVKTKGVIRGFFKARSAYVCGIEFFKLSSINMDKIYKYVVERQREELRKVQD